MRYVITGIRGMMGSEIDRVAESTPGWTRLDPPDDLPQWTDPFDPTGAREADAANPALADWIRDIRPDVVLTAAAVIGSHKADALGYAQTIRSNVEAAGLLAEAADDSGARFVQFSSESIFSFGPLGYSVARPIDPTALPPRPQSIYGWTKWLGECAVRAAVRESNLLILYPAFGFGGPRDGISILSAMIRAVAGLPGYSRVVVPLDPDFLKQPTWHEDIGRYAVAAVERGLSGVRVVASASPVRYSEVIEVVRDVSGVEPNLEMHPEADYKGDDHFDRAVAERDWRAVGLEPTPLRAAIAEELERTRRVLHVRPHVTRMLVEAMKRAKSETFRPWTERAAR